MKLLLLLCISLNPVVKAGFDEGDSAFEAMNYQNAVTFYEKMLPVYEDNTNLQWRLARVYVCLGDISEKREKETFYRKAVTHARKAVELDPANSNAHTWLAASLGNIAMFEGSESKVKLCSEIKTSLDRAITLDPQNDVAYSVLGSFYRALGNINWFERQLAQIFIGKLPEGGFAESEIALKQAIALSPNVIRHQFELGVLYYDWGKKDEAKAIFQEAVKLPKNMASDEKRIEKMNRFLNGEMR